MLVNYSCIQNSARAFQWPNYYSIKIDVLAERVNIDFSLLVGASSFDFSLVKSITLPIDVYAFFPNTPTNLFQSMACFSCIYSEYCSLNVTCISFSYCQISYNIMYSLSFISTSWTFSFISYSNTENSVRYGESIPICYELISE